jgi:4-amino-4-deoxy-L-arabinose transferase-like glycosyltransferase
MKRTISFLFLLALLSAISGYLLSKASWIGKVGMTFFYKEYNLLKIWWQGGAAVLIVMLVLFYLHKTVENKLTNAKGKAVHFILLLAAVGALYLTYNDFTNDYAHRILGRRFHYGFYLAWAEWMLICIFFLLKKNKKIVITQDRKETVAV